MNKFMRSLFLVCTLAVFSGCVGGKYSTWGHFHGDLSNQGFQAIDSGFALSSRWVSEPYKITGASPVIGKDLQGREVLYIGTCDGMLVAVRSEDGSEKWRRSFGSVGSETRIVSSASVSDKGNIYVITSRKVGAGRASSTLHKVDHFGYPKWSYTFPDNGFTSGSPKITTVRNDTLIFVYVSVDVNSGLQGELFALRDDGYEAHLLDRKSLGICHFDIAGRKANLLDFFEDTWRLLSTFPVEFDEHDVGLPDYFLDPTVAVVIGSEKPRIAIADNLCSLGVFEWDGVELSVLWHEGHDFDKHSSAMVSPNGLMVFGRRDGKVSAYDLETGVKMWEYNAEQAVFATPAADREKYVFIISTDQIQVISALDGTLIQDDKLPRKLQLLGGTLSSPAVTANRVYVSTFEMLTTTYDLKARGHDTNFHGNGLSSVIVGSDGSVYGIAADGTIRKYAGMESE
ncbi:MAG: PQQ-binding-like beta-propeller repeat protein [Desulfobacterales bacterium]